VTRFLKLIVKLLGAAALLLVAAAGTCIPAAAGDKDKEQEAQELLRSAHELRNHGHQDEALSAFKKANKLRGNSCAECYLGIAQVDQDTDDEPGAIENAEKAVKFAAADKAMAAQARNLKGVALMSLVEKPNDKKLAEAITEFRSALDLFPGLGMARFNLGVALIKQGNEADGLRELQAYLAQSVGEAADEARRIIQNPDRARRPYSPDFAFPTLEGQVLSLTGLRGKTVLIDFWGTWCPPCREAVPALIDINKKFSKQPFLLIGISSDSDDAKWRDFVAKKKMDWAEYRDGNERVLEAFHVKAFPTYVLVDPSGIIRFRKSGYSNTTYIELESEIKKVLKDAKEHPMSEVAGSAPASPAAPGADAGTETNEAADAFPESARGSVNDDLLYRNDFFGFTLQLPDDWDELPAELLRQRDKLQASASAFARANGDHTPGEQVFVQQQHSLLFAFQDAEQDRLVPPWQRPSIRIAAKTSFPGMPDMKSYLRFPPSPQVVQIGDVETVTLGGQPFVCSTRRITFQGAEDWNKTLLVARQGYILEITLTGASQEALAAGAQILNSLKFFPPGEN
jgi:thiol-disulfide isomerase/thioredoxin